MNTNQILKNIIENNRNDGVPENILLAFQQETIESGYDLSSKEGISWYSTRSVLAKWHEGKRAGEKVMFWWDFEEVGMGEFVKSVFVDGIDIPGINEYAQDNGLAAARRYVKKIARKAGKIFEEVTDRGIGNDFARARIRAINEARR